VLKQIARRADGVPLFVEELTKASVELARAPSKAASAQPSGVVPGTLQATLAARLDRLEAAREIARTAAVIGREFQFDLLLAVLPMKSADTLQALLQKLISAELILPVSSFPSATFAFRHALIQEAAYASLLRGERKELHSRIAEAMRLRFLVGAQPEVLAWHLTRAELFQPAVKAWLEAGSRAAEQGAFLEGEAHLREALKLVAFLPEADSRRQELELQLALGPAVMATRGYAAEESLEVYSRAAQLVSVAGSPRERMDVYLGLYNVHVGRAELERAMAVAVQYMQLAEAEHLLHARAYTLLGQTHAAMGAFAQARQAFERAHAMFAEAPETPETVGVFGSQHVIALAFVSGVYFALGEPALAESATARSIERARELGNTLSIALALVTDLLTPIPGGLRADRAQAEKVIQFCRDNSLRNFEAWALFASGAIEARRGDPREGIENMRTAIAMAEAMNSRLFRPVQYATLASAHSRLGQLEEASRLIEEAIRTAARTGERRADAALHRLQGELLLKRGKREAARLAMMRGLEIARAQQMRPEETRIENALRASARTAALLRRVRSLFRR
jgi:tetratricopeptide (TPR) repeat protein